MYVFLRIAYFSLYNILHTLKSPLFFIVLFIIFIQYRKIGKLEKDIIGLNTKPIIYNIVVSTAFGLLGGLIGSIIFIYFETTINPQDFYYILPLAILLSLAHPRFICFSYAGGIIGLVSLIFDVAKINIPGILMIIGVLHLVESLLILIDGNSMRIPIFMERDMEIVGGFMLNRFWPVPLTIFLNGQGVYPATIIAILGYGDYALTNYPEKKSKETAGLLFMFSLILLILANLSLHELLFQYIGVIFSPLGHEIVISLGNKKEKEGKYLFKPSPYGLKILDVLPNSVGKAMDLNSGDIITSLNGKRIYFQKDVEEVLIYRPSYIWMEVFTADNRLVTKEFQDYRNGIKNLGLVTVGPAKDHHYIVKEGKSIFSKSLDRFRNRRARFKN